MELQGYLDLENERKANRIRQLMTEAYSHRRNVGSEITAKLSKEALELSNQLKDYLLKTYPDKFNIIRINTNWQCAQYSRDKYTQYTE